MAYVKAGNFVLDKLDKSLYILGTKNLEMLPSK